MAVIVFALLIAALVCFGLAAFGVATRRVNTIGLGLACWVLTEVLAAWPGA